MFLSSLLTSCFSYKNLESSQMEFREADTYRITKKGKSVKRGRFDYANDNSIFLQGRKGQLIEISRKEIHEIKRREFSLGKTIALPVCITAVAAGISINGLSNLGSGFDW